MESVVDIINNNIIFNSNKINYLTDKDNNIWFKAKDVADILGYANPQKAVRDHVREKHYKIYEKLKVNDSFTLHPHTVYISEPGLYSLILKSNMPIAEKFQDWVVEEVLPSIRRYGEYKIESKYRAILGNLNHKLESLTEKVEELKQDVVSKPSNPNKHHQFILIEKNHMWEYPYYVLRIQKCKANNRINVLRTVYPDLAVILRLEYNPNSINLYNKMKETIDMIYYGNHFETRLSQNELLYEILNIVPAN